MKGLVQLNSGSMKLHKHTWWNLWESLFKQLGNCIAKDEKKRGQTELIRFHCYKTSWRAFLNVESIFAVK